MKDLLNRLSRRRFPYEPLISVNISRDRLIHNMREFMKVAAGGRVAPVLKSNAYGHGLLEVAGIIETERRNGGNALKTKIPFIIVDSYFEAVAIRAVRIRTPLLIIGYTRPETIARSRLRDVSFTITSIDQLKHIANFQSYGFDFGTKHVNIHLKIDTGMHRQGVLPEEIEEVSEILDRNDTLVLKGICSHFADADNPDPSFTEGQIRIWNKIAKQMHDQYASLEYIHISNTDGNRYAKEAYGNLSRLGLGLYGLIDGSVFSPKLDIRPVLSMETIISATKKIARDQGVGYGASFKADKDMTIATLPAGYYEGIDRRLSNKGFVLVGPERIACPIVGRVSMNITTIDVSHVQNPVPGMRAVIISDDPADPNSIVNIAKLAENIAHDAIVHIPERLKRNVE